MLHRPATVEDVVHVCCYMREIHVDERWATQCFGDRSEVRAAVAAQFAALHPQRLGVEVFCDPAGDPVAFVGAYLDGPRHGHVYMLATDAWLSVARPAYRWMRQHFVPTVLEPNLAVAFTEVMDRGARDRLWLHMAGFLDHGPPLPIGRGGERIVMLAWVNPELR